MLSFCINFAPTHTHAQAAPPSSSRRPSSQELEGRAALRRSERRSSRGGPGLRSGSLPAFSLRAGWGGAVAGRVGWRAGWGGGQGGVAGRVGGWGGGQDGGWVGPGGAGWGGCSGGPGGGGPGGVVAGRMGGVGTYVHIARKGVCMAE